MLPQRYIWLVSALACLLGPGAVGSEFPCSDRVFVQSLDLSQLPTGEIAKWSPKRRVVFLERLAQEARSLVAEKADLPRLPPRFARLVDLSLVALRARGTPGQFGGASPLSLLGISRRHASWQQVREDLGSEGEIIGEDPIFPMDDSGNYLEVQGKLGVRIFTQWMRRGSLHRALAAWGVYKIRFVLPDTESLSRRILVDWVPGFLKPGSPDSATISFIYREPGSQWQRDEFGRPGETLGTLETRTAQSLFAPYSEMAIPKAIELGWDVLEEIFPNDYGGLPMVQSLLVGSGYNEDPFSPEENFWARQAEWQPVLAPMIVSAAKWLKKNEYYSLPAGFLPKKSRGRLLKQARVLGARTNPEAASLVLDELLQFSGPMKIARFQRLYPDEGSQTFFRSLYPLGEISQYLGRRKTQLFNRYDVPTQERELWMFQDWIEFDMLRLIEFMESRGLWFDRAKQRWRRKMADPTEKTN